jgi:MoaA/NifB/PqqE/SkfB family radical SAM enzyme
MKMENLKHIEINIWKVCNNKCIFCMSQKSGIMEKKFVDLETLKKSIKSYYNKWYKSIWFLWWDVSIYPKIYELMSFCKETWYTNISVITNWMVFSDKLKADKLIESWVTRINISIHSHNPEIEDLITWVKGWFEKKIKAIRNFINNKKLQSLLSINIVINKINLKEILETVLYFAIKEKITDIRLNFVMLEDNIEKIWYKVTVSYTEIMQYIKKIIYIWEKYGTRITFDSVPACILHKIYSDKSEYYIKKYLWEQFDHIDEVFSINEGDKFSRQDRKKNVLKITFENCKKCMYYKVCQWVWKNYGVLYGEKEFIPIIK